MLILPAIDLRGGYCVRLAQGDYSREKIYGQDPVALARLFESEGAEWLHVVDLDGAKSGVPTNLGAVSAIAKETGLKIEFGGGIRSLQAAEQALEAGASRVVVGTKLIQDPDLAQEFFQKFGEGVVAGIDARDGFVALHGWTEGSTRTAEDVAVWVQEAGAKRIILTDISRDGMLTGPNIDLLKQITRATSIPIIQSGGISALQDLTLLLSLGQNCPEGVIVGRALYENKFTVQQAVQTMKLEPLNP